MAHTPNRLVVLDSYRALAALYVVCYHFFHRWTDLPEGQQLVQPTPFLSSISSIEFGHLGVEFFFIISGFVIALTLENTRSVMDFAVKRFARLFPPMLAAAVFTFLFVALISVQPFSDVRLVDFLPSLTFISPQVFNKIFGLETDWISGVYWSLFVEVKFYFYAAVVYFLAPKAFIRNYFLLSISLTALYWFAVSNEIEKLENVLNLVFFPKYAFLFVAGMIFYRLHSDGIRYKDWTIAILTVAVAYSVFVYSSLNPVRSYSMMATTIVLLFHVLFILFILDSPLLRPLKSTGLASIGAASYSLYLLHESVGVSIIVRANSLFEWSLWPVVVIPFVVGLSMVFYARIETPARRLIRSAYADSSLRHWFTKSG